MGDGATPSIIHKPINSLAGSQDIEKYLQVLLERGRPSPEKVICSRSYNDSRLESASSCSYSAQLPLAFKPQAPEGHKEVPRSRMLMVPGLLVSWVPSLFHPPVQFPPLPSSVILLTFTDDPKRHLILLPQLCNHPLLRHTTHMFSNMFFHFWSAPGLRGLPAPQQPLHSLSGH